MAGFWGYQCATVRCVIVPGGLRSRQVPAGFHAAGPRSCGAGISGLDCIVASRPESRATAMACLNDETRPITTLASRATVSPTDYPTDCDADDALAASSSASSMALFATTSPTCSTEVNAAWPNKVIALASPFPVTGVGINPAAA